MGLPTTFVEDPKSQDPVMALPVKQMESRYIHSQWIICDFYNRTACNSEPVEESGRFKKRVKS